MGVGALPMTETSVAHVVLGGRPSRATWRSTPANASVATTVHDPEPVAAHPGASRRPGRRARREDACRTHARLRSRAAGRPGVGRRLAGGRSLTAAPWHGVAAAAAAAWACVPRQMPTTTNGIDAWDATQ